MRRITILIFMASVALASRADDTQTAPLPVTQAPMKPPPPVQLVPKPAWSPRPARPLAVAPNVESSQSTEGDRAAVFNTEAKWDLAGYNNDEVIYTIFIENLDPRIIRCVIELSGFYIENGEKHPVKDRQSDTVFPAQRVQAGNWQGMDKDSGATYSVKCHATT